MIFVDFDCVVCCLVVHSICLVHKFLVAFTNLGWLVGIFNMKFDFFPLYFLRFNEFIKIG